MEYLIVQKPYALYKKKSKVLLLLLMLSLLLSGCSLSEQSVSRSGFYFDTIITITLYGTEDEGYIDECFAMAEHYEALFSAQDEDSDVSRINAAEGAFVTVDEETLALLAIGISYGDLSNGKFDITIGTLSDLWDISGLSENLSSENKEADASVLPTEDEIAEALSHVDYQKIEIRDGQVRLTDPEAKLDLGAIAKGYIADRMKEYLTEAGITSGIINLGGNVLTIGEKADGSSYTIGIQKPFADQGEVIETVSIRDLSVVSSGVYERYFTVDGTRYHHILDTATGYPYDNGLYEVSIISESSVDGDALSTACFSLGLEDGMALVDSLDDIEAIFITDDYEIIKSSGLT